MMNQTQNPGNVSHPYPMTALIHGRFSGGFGWIAYPNEFMRRSSTALVHDGRVWVIDPVYTTGIDAEIEALGTIAGIILTVGHHDRDAIWFAERYDVPLYVPGNLITAPKGGPAVRVAGQIPHSPLQLLPCGGRGAMAWFQECAIWWPEHRLLITGDTIGTAGYFAAANAVGAHPFFRLSPPVSLLRLPVSRLYPGHGRSVIGDGVSEAVATAISTARSNLVAGWVQAFRYIQGR